MLSAVTHGGAPPAAAEQIEVRADLRKRVAGRINAIHSRNRIENNLPPLWLQVVHNRRQRNGAKKNVLTVGRPARTGIGDGITLLGYLDKDAELDGLFGQTRSELFEQKIG